VRSQLQSTNISYIIYPNRQAFWQPHHCCELDIPTLESKGYTKFTNFLCITEGLYTII